MQYAGRVFEEYRRRFGEMDEAQHKFWTFALNTAYDLGASHESHGKSEWTREIVSPEKWPAFNAKVVPLPRRTR